MLQNKLILASSSPRRAEILKMAGFLFEVRKYPFEENPPNAPAERIPEMLALQKLDQVKDSNEGEITITADTLVIMDHEIIGKPKGHDNAFEILNRLSGKMHSVITGVGIRFGSDLKSFSTTTQVYFDPLSEKEIEDYLKEYKPFDKAGAYGIQEGIGLTKVAKIDGCFYNVMGLPLRDLYNQLNSSFSI